MNENLGLRNREDSCSSKHKHDYPHNNQGLQDKQGRINQQNYQRWGRYQKGITAHIVDYSGQQMNQDISKHTDLYHYKQSMVSNRSNYKLFLQHKHSNFTGIPTHKFSNYQSNYEIQKYQPNMDRYRHKHWQQDRRNQQDIHSRILVYYCICMYLHYICIHILMLVGLLYKMLALNMLYGIVLTLDHRSSRLLSGLYKLTRIS